MGCWVECKCVATVQNGLIQGIGISILLIEILECSSKAVER